jgi:hypothetical protein
MSDRKYRQRGYMESDNREHRPSSLLRRRDPLEAPRGRGLGGPNRRVFRCERCGREQHGLQAVARDSRCTACGADLHSCIHCTHFDPAAFRQCTQPILERIPAKDRANDCSFFTPRWRQESSGGEPDSGRSAGGDPRAAFDALFKF